MTSKTSSLTLRLAVLAIVTNFASGCATVHSDLHSCPPIVPYDQQFLDRAAEELAALPANSAIDQMLRDYVVMRDQARACRRS